MGVGRSRRAWDTLVQRARVGGPLCGDGSLFPAGGLSCISFTKVGSSHPSWTQAHVPLFCGLSVSPQNAYVEVLTSGTLFGELALFGELDFTDGQVERTSLGGSGPV